MNDRIELGLLVLRLGLGAFLLFFGTGKRVAPYAAVEVFARCDFTDKPPSAACIA